MSIDKFKVMTIIGTRPEIIRLSRVIEKLDENVNHSMVFTNQSYDYELSTVFFDQLNIRKPDYFLNVRGETIGIQIANILRQTEVVLDKEQPDAVLILGDTNSSLSSILAKRKKILIFHMEAGNRCFDWEVPEEINRRIVDHISDYNLAYTEHARRNLLQEGIPSDTIIVTGSPLKEVYEYYQKDIDASDILNKLKLNEGEYIIISCHREENINNKARMKNLFESLQLIKELYKKRIIVSLHPRTRLEIDCNAWEKSGIELFKPFGFFEYANLEKYAFCVLSDSGTIQEESAMLNFPAIQIRYSTERPEAFDAGSIVVCGLTKNSVIQAVSLSTIKDTDSEIPVDYTKRNVSTKVVKYIVGMIGTRKR